MPVPASTVLYVEDDPDDVFFLRRALQAQNLQYNLQSVSTVQAAKSYLTGQVPYEDRARYPMPDLIITDMTIPDAGESSVDLASWLRSTPEIARLPVICATGNDQPSMIQQFADLGIACVQKTSRMTEIADAIKAALNQQGPA
jgi:CheY-like chemotaxis protein